MPDGALKGKQKVAKRKTKVLEGQMPLPGFAPDSDWTPPSLSDLPDLTKFTGRVGLDTETKDPGIGQKLGPGFIRRDGHITGYSFALEDGPKFYIPVRHEGGGNVDVDQAFNYIRHFGKHFKGEIVGANLAYEIGWFGTEDVTFDQATFRDIQILDPLLYELHFSYSLLNIGKRYDMDSKNEDMLKRAADAFNVDAKAGMHKLHSKFVGLYAEDDALNPLLILRKQEERMRKMIEEDAKIRGRMPERTLEDVWQLECDVLPVLAKLKKRGIRIDEDKLDHIRLQSLIWEKEQLDFIKDKTGVDIGVGNTMNAGVCAKALEEIGVDVPITGKTKKPSIDQKLLDSIDHPVAGAIKRARKVFKLRSTFVSSIMTHMVKGRLHSSYNQIAMEKEGANDTKGARFGRLSSDTPNIQQQPSRDDFAPLWRSIYLPEEGRIFCSNDYSQQEPRWTTHFAAELDLPKAREAAQAYHDNPKMDNHQFMADLTGLPRKFAKNIYLGICYGEGGFKLAGELGLPTRTLVSGKVNGRWGSYPIESEEGQQLVSRGMRRFEGAGEEAQAVLDAFNERAPYVRALAKVAEKQAKRIGYVTTIYGRRLHFLKDKAGNYDWTYRALNRIIQGTSADKTKLAMVTLDRELPEYYMQMQVHDEINASIESTEIGMKAADVMANVIPARVPFRVDSEQGPSWGEAELLEAA